MPSRPTAMMSDEAGYIAIMLLVTLLPKVRYPMIPKTSYEAAAMPIEMPITLFIRLLANMIAGHLILGLFFSASTYLFLGYQDGRWWTAFFGLGSFFGAVAFTFFEVLVSALQAYIFTLLTAVYLAGSLEPEH